MPHGKPLSNPREVGVGAFRGLLTASAGREELGRGPVKPQDRNGSCGACGAERDGHPVARPPLPFCDHPGIILPETLGPRVRWHLSRRRTTGGRSDVVKSGGGPRGKRGRERAALRRLLTIRGKLGEILGDPLEPKMKPTSGYGFAVSGWGLAAIAPAALLPMCAVANKETPRTGYSAATSIRGIERRRHHPGRRCGF